MGGLVGYERRIAMKKEVFEFFLKFYNEEKFSVFLSYTIDDLKSKNCMNLFGGTMR